MDDRSDGLLRGSRSERGEQMRELGSSTWSLPVLLDLHTGLLDHAEPVRNAAMHALLALAKQDGTNAVHVAPLDMIARYGGNFTASSGMWGTIFAELVQMGSPAADDVALRMISGSCRYDDFESALHVLKVNGRADLLQRVPIATLPKKKQTLLGRHQERRA
jgi:hypothetical protein